MTEYMYSVKPLPAFTDNYIWLLETSDGRCAVVDPGEAGPVLAELDSRNLKLEAILLTHHHGDHVGGVREILARFPVPVYGSADSRVPFIDHPLKDGEQIQLLGTSFQVLAIPGHTLDHIAFYGESPEPRLFCGDTLFAAGCGRIFEGTPEQMHTSLTKLAGLPDSTEIYCAHEYTLSNLKFALSLEPDNPQLQQRFAQCEELRSRLQPTLPSRMDLERATNPFLRSNDPAIKAAVQQSGASANSDLEVFTQVRRLKDHF